MPLLIEFIQESAVISEKYYVMPRIPNTSNLILAVITLPLVLCPAHVFSKELPSIEPDEILAILQDTTTTAAEIPNKFARAEFYDQIATALVELGYLEKAIGMADRKDNVSRDGTLKKICQFLLEHGRILEAFQTAKKVQERHWVAWVFQEIAPQLTDEDQKRQALKLLQKASTDLLQEKGFFQSPMGISMVGKIAEAQYLLGDGKASRRTVEQLWTYAKGSPDFPEAKEEYFQELALIQGNSGAMPQALATLQFIRNVEDQQTVLRRIARNQVWEGNIPQAQILLEKLDDPYDRDGIRKVIAKFHADQDEFQQAWTIIKQMTHSEKKKAEALIHIAQRQRERRDIQSASVMLGHASHTVASIKRSTTRADLFGHIAQIQAKMGDSQGSRRTLTTALEAYKTIRKEKKKAPNLVNIVLAHGELGNFQEGLALLNTMTSEWYMNRTACWFATIQAQKGDIEGALRTALLSKGYDYMWRGFTLQRIAKAQAQQGDYQAALIWANHQLRSSEKASAFLGIAQGLIALTNP